MRLSFVMLGAVLLLSACNGIYDDPVAEDAEATDKAFTNLPAADYDKWVYVNLHDRSYKVVSVGDDAQIPENWDIAIHRYDCKTHDAEVMETGFSSLASIQASGVLPEGTWETDQWTTDKIAVDMSGMMQGVIRYTEDWCNLTLTKWLDVDTSTMPPIYTPSGRVYLVRFSDGTIAAIRFTNFMNAEGVKGYISFNYVYPLQIAE